MGARATSCTPTAATSRRRWSWTRSAGGECSAPDISLPTGYGWSFPAGEEVRVGVGSFDPRFHVKDTTVMLAEDLEREAVRYQGNWIPHRLRAATADGVFFVGDSAGHCLPLTAEGIRTALYFGIACGRELRAVIDGRQPVASALTRYDDFSEGHRRKFEVLLAGQRVLPRIPPRLLHRGIGAMQTKRFVDWSFGHYLNIAPPSFATATSAPRRSGEHVRSSAAWEYGRSQSSRSPSSAPQRRRARPPSRV
jgi:flavin-dependent dehydrogenase